MTFPDAYAKLLAAWPTSSFSVDIHVWHYEHLPHDPPAVEYRVWNGRLRESFEGPTLETAVTLALGAPAGLGTLEAVEREIRPYADGSGYEIVGPLTLVTP